ncbi:glycosyltransferase [Kordiimonas gwangyangensis]|uniref:glycosyltransferase n=1 Tax=Kordiimonas gwangyangensis TaxID=288022 RepID=UPI00035D6FA4|nr:glycosyltransferase [Kordiimonas gwangyangensis]
MPSICFVTNEIYPLNKGGIGRLLYNIAVENSKSVSPADIHLLMVWQPEEEQAAVRQALDGLAKVYFCPLSGMRHGGWIADFERSNDLTWHYGHAYRQSLMLYAGLLEYEAALGHGFDYIEFPDFGGWGLASIEAKAAGLAFTSSRIVVRLHSTGGIVDAHQPYYDKPGHWSGCVKDMEYLSLKKADLVVGHLDEIVEYNRAFYGFDESWARRAVVELPPLGLTPHEEESRSGDEASVGERDFIFSSRLQPFKQPDIFIKAALYFLEQRPDYQGRFRLISYGWDARYINSLKALIPEGEAARILIETEVSAEDRLKALRQGIVVIPSNYESLCLFAFEASQLSSMLILNGDCLAFGGDTFWKEGRNCLKFAGTAKALAGVMVDALTKQLPEVVSFSTSAPYWTQAFEVPAAVHSAETLTVIAHGFAQAEDVLPALEALRPQLPTATTLRLMLPKAWRDDLAGELGDTDVSWHPGMTLWWQDACALLENHEGLLAFMGPDVVVDSDYFPRALAAMAANPDLAAYAAHAAIDFGKRSESTAIRLYSGAAPSAAVLASEPLPPAAVLRAARILELPTVKRLMAIGLKDECWYDLLARAVAYDNGTVVIEPAPSINIPGGNLREPGDAATDGTLLETYLMADTGKRPVFLQGLNIRELPVLPLSHASLDLSHGLRGARQIEPMVTKAEWQPVTYQMTERMLQVHPMPKKVVVVSLPLTHEDAGDVVGIRLRHFGPGNPGVNFRMRCQPHDSLLNMKKSTKWVTIRPGEIVELELKGLDKLTFDSIEIEAKPTKGKNTSFAWTFVDRLWTY